MALGLEEEGDLLFLQRLSHWGVRAWGPSLTDWSSFLVLPLAVMCPWANYLISLSFSFLIIIIAASRIVRAE